MNKAYETHKLIQVFAPVALGTSGGTLYSYSDKAGTGTSGSAVGIDCRGWRKATVIQETGIKVAADTSILTAYITAAATLPTSLAKDAGLISGFTLQPTAGGTGSSVQKGEINLTGVSGLNSADSPATTITGGFLILKIANTVASSGTLAQSVSVLLEDPIIAPGGDTAAVSV